MRTPNAACILCGKPLYRRPNELARVRYVACMAHRAEAQSVVGVTEAQNAGLRLGRPKGTNHRTGYRHREESKRKVSAANRAFWASNPEKAIARGAKTRGPLNVRWKGGAKRLNVSIRQMRENRKWMDAVKARDGACVRCGSGDGLEAHHKVDLAVLVERFGITSRDAARAEPALWDLNNGETLCQACHLAQHGRKLNGSRAHRRSRQREAAHAHIG